MLAEAAIRTVLPVRLAEMLTPPNTRCKTSRFHPASYCFNGDGNAIEIKWIEMILYLHFNETTY